MNYLESYEKDLVKETSNVQKFVGDMIIINSRNILDTVKRRWILGKSVDGGIIGNYASAEYRQFKIAMNPSAGGVVDLHLTGSLSENLTVKQAGTLFEIYSSDEKFEKIGRKYGFEEFGLSEAEQNELFEEIYAIGIEYIINNLWQ